MKQHQTSTVTLLIALIIAGLIGVDCRKPVITFVTALWDVKRGDFKNSQRSYDKYYLPFYKELLQTDNNLIAFGDAQLKQFTAKNRPHPNTIFIQKQLIEIQKYWHTPKIWSAIHQFQQHPDKYDWEYMSGLSHYGLKMYNPVVMSKLFLMRQALKKDTFNSDYFIWTDGGLTHALNKEFLYEHSIDKIVNYYEIDWFFIANKAWKWDSMEKGFKQNGYKYRTENPTQITQTSCWANWFGGKVEALSTVLSIYQNMLRITLENNQMSTDQSVFTFMLQRYPYMLTKLNTQSPDKFAKFEADKLSYYDENKVERVYNVASLDRASPIASFLPMKPMIIVKASSYESSIYHSIRGIYQKTLYFRLLTAIIIMIAYSFVKIRYLNHQTSNENSMIAINPNEES